MAAGFVEVNVCDFCSVSMWYGLLLTWDCKCLEITFLFCVFSLGSGDKVLALAGFEVEKAKK